MLKAIAGSVVGGIVAAAVAIVATAPARSAPAALEPAASVPSATLVDQLDGRAIGRLPAEVAAAEPTLVQCEPHQRAELRRVVIDGREASQIACTTIVQRVASAPSDIVTAPAPRPGVERPVVVRERVVTREPVRQSATRSWAKSALVIGGSSGAGAGVGGLVGGKKGALVGAAIGGGSAAIFEAIKR